MAVPSSKVNNSIHCIRGPECLNFLFLVDPGRLDSIVRSTSISIVFMPKALNKLTSKLLEFSKILLSHGKRGPPLLPPLRFLQEF